jgi:hemoglobin
MRRPQEAGCRGSGHALEEQPSVAYLKPSEDALYQVSVLGCAHMSVTQVELSEEQIGALLDLFYTKVRADPELGPVFARAIAADEWPAHIANIQDFWSAVMLRSGRYKGNPFEVHKAVAGISPELFQRWLALFDEACRHMLAPDLAEAMHGRAVQIAESLKAGLFFRPGAAV